MPNYSDMVTLVNNLPHTLPFTIYASEDQYFISMSYIFTAVNFFPGWRRYQKLFFTTMKLWETLTWIDTQNSRNGRKPDTLIH